MKLALHSSPLVLSLRFVAKEGDAGKTVIV